MKRPLVHLALFVFLSTPGCSCSSDAPPGAERDGSADAIAPLVDGDVRRDIGVRDDGGGTPTGCPIVPSSDFDPRSAYVPPALTANVVVSSVADDGAGSLRAALRDAPAGAVVGFAPDLAGRTIALESTLVLTQSVTLTGAAAPGLTVDAQRRGSAFRYGSDSAAVLRFFSLRIVNGRTAGSGGAITVNGNEVELEVGGCTFEDNAANEGGAIRYGYRQKPANIHDSVFLRNDGALPGGDRAGFSGGAISSIGGLLRIARCRFEDNQGTTTGAVYAIHADPLIEDSVFIRNRSTGSSGSGAFFSDGGGPGDYGTDYTDPANDIPGQITLRRTRFEDNRGAGDDGGAVEAYAYPLDAVTIEDSVFFGNRAEPGRAGAVFIHADLTVRVARTAFVDNVASGVGGAIWADGSAAYEFENVLFSGNVAMDDLGGALRLNIADDARLRIDSSTFVDNSARDANGAIWMGGRRDARITNSIFANNTFRGGGQQVNFLVDEGGGNIEWPAPSDASHTLSMARNLDPMLAPLAAAGGMYTRLPGSGSPALDTAVLPAPATDLLGAPRGATPDVGAFEVGSACR